MFLSKTRVVIVDDSSATRNALQKALRRRSGVEVVGMTDDAYKAKDLIVRNKPDVLLLDLEMPTLDGLSFLKVLMRHRPMPVVIMSDQSRHGSAATMEALNSGAVDILAKPGSDRELETLGHEIVRKLKSASAAKLRIPKQPATRPATLPHAVRNAAPSHYRPSQCIVIGASTGGTEALKTVLEELTPNLPPIFIVQHIPAGFSQAFANRVNKHSMLNVREATHGEIARQNDVLIAPGNFHMRLDWDGRQFKVLLDQDEPVWHQRPAVDHLFESVPPPEAKYCVGAILTGMGRDGARGLLKLRQAGAFTIGQDSETCAVYGMPKAAFELGGVVQQLPLDRISQGLAAAVKQPIIAAPRAL